MLKTESPFFHVVVWADLVRSNRDMHTQTYEVTHTHTHTHTHKHVRFASTLTWNTFSLMEKDDFLLLTTFAVTCVGS